MRELEITWGRVLRVWWASFWMGLLCVFLPCFVAGFIFGGTFAILHIPLEGHAWVFRLVGIVVGIPAGFWVLRQVLQRRYKDFRIAFIALEPEAPASAAATQPPPI